MVPQFPHRIRLEKTKLCGREESFFLVRNTLLDAVEPFLTGSGVSGTLTVFKGAVTGPVIELFLVKIPFQGVFGFSFTFAPASAGTYTVKITTTGSVRITIDGETFTSSGGDFELQITMNALESVDITVEGAGWGGIPGITSGTLVIR